MSCAYFIEIIEFVPHAIVSKLILKQSQNGNRKRFRKEGHKDHYEDT